MGIEELIKYIYETPLEETKFNDMQQKGDRALILLSKYGDNKQQELIERFGNMINFNAITPKTAMTIMNIINNKYFEKEKIEKPTDTITEEDLLNFKKTLEYFIHILRANNKDNDEKFIGDEAKSGQGYKGQSIRKSYEEFRHYSNGRTIDISISPGFQLFQKTCYVNWSSTGYNIRAIWNDERNDISALRLYVDVANEWVGEEVSILDLGLNDGENPNENLKDFYKNFLNLLLNDSKNNSMIEEFVNKLKNSKNIIFHGSPGTGKSYFAKKIASDIVSNGKTQDYMKLSDEQKSQIGFVQFHPSYDYTDFVEGLRPVTNNDGTIGFELQDGVFKKFISKAEKNYQNSQLSPLELSVEENITNALFDYLSKEIDENKPLKLLNGSEFIISNFDENNVSLINNNNNFESTKNLKIPISKLISLLKYKDDINSVKDIRRLEGRSYATQVDSYIYVLIKKITVTKEKIIKEEAVKPFVFIIDEINRGEISKIFGELFFSIDPGYRGKNGEISTQYANLHKNTEEKFYIPDNVYIIGTMNDIDRSVDSFDFAMRRRFRFIEIKAEDTISMWHGNLEDSKIEEATKRLLSLNNQISSTEGLNSNYHVGPSYFLKLPELDYDYGVLWEDYLKPLLEEYLRGSYEEQENLDKMKEAFDLKDIINEVGSDEDRG